LVEYKGNKTKVKIICKKHGIFEQTPNGHCDGRGCPACAEYGFSVINPGNLYYIKFESEQDLPLYKVGITNFEDALKRIKSMGLYKGFKATILKIMRFDIGAEAYALEQMIHKEYAEHRYYGDPIMDNGNTELFVTDILGYDTAAA
jgi:hypothetical protein